MTATRGSTRKVSLREEAYRLLQSLQKRYGATSLSDTVLLLAERAQQCTGLEERLHAVEKRLEELEALQRKTYLALLRLIEELAAQREEEGPESPRAQGDGEVGLSRSVRKVSSTDPEPAGREPRQDIG